MSATLTAMFDNPAADWEIPTFNVARWDGKVHEYCVVIPASHDTRQLQAVLARMAELKIGRSADVIVVGHRPPSARTDLRIDQLHRRRVENAAGLRAYLVQTGPGELSALLRCAYAFALQQGYDGVITLEGNDKNDPVTIPKFIAALEAGVDFVQASRYQPEASAADTPPLRRWAVRWIHAPICSLASGYHWTDTTQTFRGYSADLLMDTRIAPFRAVFNNDELPAHLSCQAPKLGYRCLELPTTRHYPEQRAGRHLLQRARHYLHQLKVLLRAATGRYAPQA